MEGSSVAAGSLVDLATLEILPYGIVILDDTGTVLYYNAREEQIARRDRLDVLGRNFFHEVAPCTEVAEFYGRFVEAMSSGESPVEFSFRFPFTPHSRDVEIAFKPFAAGGRRLCLVSVRDVAETDFVRDRINSWGRFASIGEVASGVGHNLNNTLMAIRTWASVLKREISGSSRGARALDEIMRATADAESIVRRLNSTPSEIWPDVQVIDLSVIARDAISQVRGRIEAKTATGVLINVRTAFESALPPIYGVASELREVLVNLLSNAVDALYDSGDVVISTGTAESFVYVEVADTGKGMTDDIQSKLFRPFFTTKGSSGTGLGLTTSYAIVRKHGGLLRVRSAPGAGSTFTVLLPLRNSGSSLDPSHPTTGGRTSL